MKTCRRCLTTITLYQSKLCKTCLHKDFVRLRPLLTVRPTLAQSINVKVPSPLGEGLIINNQTTPTNCGVRSLGQGQ